MYQLKGTPTTPTAKEQKEEIIIIKILKSGGGTYAAEAQTCATGPLFS